METMTDRQFSAENPSTGATDPKGPTGILATWAASTALDLIPDTVKQRAKYLLLDGIGCLLVGSHLDWSALGVEAITDFDPSGEYMIAAWGGKKTRRLPRRRC